MYLFLLDIFTESNISYDKEYETDLDEMEIITNFEEDNDNEDFREDDNDNEDFREDDDDNEDFREDDDDNEDFREDDDDNIDGDDVAGMEEIDYGFEEGEDDNYEEDDDDVQEDSIVDASLGINQMPNIKEGAPYFENVTSTLLFCWIQKHDICKFDFYYIGCI